jgi:type I restriction enzyme S subunit
MTAEWQDTTLGEVLELKRGYDLPKSKREPGRIPIISSSGESDTHSVAKVRGPGVVTGRYGTIGEVFYSANDFWPLNTTLYVRNFKGNDEKFIYYFLKTIDYRQYSDKAAVPGVNRNHLHLAEVRIPTSIEEQKAIAHILGTLDDKIELNRQMNATLEAMAQALFKSWFVDFDPVIDNALAAGNLIPEPLLARAEARKALGDQRKPLPEQIQKQFPNSFVFNEDMGWIPNGWEVQKFGDLVEKTIGGDWGKEEKDEKHQKCVSIVRGTDIPSVKSGVKGSTPTRWVEEKKFKTRELSEGDIVIEVSGGSPKQPTGRAVYMTKANIDMLGGNCVPASFCRKFRPKSKALGFYAAQHLDRIYALGKMWNYQNQSTGISNFQTNTFLQTECVVLPDTDVLLEAFFTTAGPMIEKGRSSEKEDLVKLRDTLLPKLLSGQLRIPEAEKQVSESV